MMIDEKIDFNKFLELNEKERYEILTRQKLSFLQRLYIKYINHWWTNMYKINSHLKGNVLWESIYKGRF